MTLIKMMLTASLRALHLPNLLQSTQRSITTHGTLPPMVARRQYIRVYRPSYGQIILL
jgi:hypothetical protein